MRLQSDPYYDSIEYRELRHSIIVRDGGFCSLCGRHGSLLGYLVPREMGGADTPENTFCICRRCAPSSRLTSADTIEAKRRSTHRSESTPPPFQLLPKSR